MPNTQCQTTPHSPAIPRQSVFRKIVSYIAIISLTFSPLAAYPSSAASVNDQEYKAALSRLDEFMRLVTQMRSHIDRSQFETGALLENLDFEAAKIIQFVTQDIYFEQYPGLLRGAQGTLMSRAGNSLDQAVLLATLLNDSAYESRIVRGELNRKQTQKLLQQMGKQKQKQKYSSGDLEKYKGVLTRMAKLANMPDDKVESFVENSFKDISIEDTSEFKDAVDSRSFILDQLKNADGSIEPLDITEELISEALDYFWVEYRLDESTEWKSIHPVFSEASDELKNITRVDVLKEKIPENLQHRFRFQVVLEQKFGNKLVKKTLVKPWEKPSANLIGKSLYFSNVPDGYKKHDDLVNPEEIAKKTLFLMPVFKVNENVIGQSESFDMKGVVVDKEAAGHSASGLFQTLGNKMEKALEKSVDMEKQKNPENGEFRNLSAQWIELTQIAPGGKEKKVKRYVIDRIGADNRAKGKAEIVNFKSREEAIWQLASTHKILLSPGTYPESYIFDRYLNRILSARVLLKASLEKTFFPSRPLAFNLKELKKIQDSTELMLANTFDRINQLDQTSVNYHHEPALLHMKNEFSYEDKAITTRIVVDIINNSLRALKQEGNRFLFATNVNILFGTWATRLEGMGRTGVDSEQASIWNTGKAFQQAQQKKIPIMLLKPEDTARVKHISGISSETKQAIQKDLANGYHVIVPEKVLDDTQQIAWWRINTETGETLGMINEGLGGEATKYSTLLILVSLFVAALLAIPGYADCRSKNQSNGRMCSLAGCLKGAGVNVLIGFAIGYSVGLIATALAAPGAVGLAAAETFSYARAAPEAVKIGIEIGVARGIDLGNATNVLPQVPNCIE